jgi:hypothetical protein
MISRITFCFAHAPVTGSLRLLGPDAVELLQAVRMVLDDVEDPLAEGAHQLAGEVRADALDHARTQVLLDAFQGAGGTTRRVMALNCSPCCRSFTHDPSQSTYSPAVTLAVEPTTVTRSRWLRTFTRSTRSRSLGCGR